MATSFLSSVLRPSIPSSETAIFVCRTCRRNAATSRRTRKLLRVKADSSFAPSKTETQDHIIFNPPSSAPNVYHTPAKFLPPSDPRRAILQQRETPIPTPKEETATQEETCAPSILAMLAARGGQRASPPAQSLSTVRPPHEKKYHLKQEQIDEIRRLRAEDPRKWTRVRLAEKFECSQFFVSLCCSAPEIKKEQDLELEKIKSRWGRRKTEARLARKERKKLWGQDN